MKIDRTDIFYIDSYFQTIPMKPMQHIESFLQYFFGFFHIQQKHSVHYLDLPSKNQINQSRNPLLILFPNQLKNELLLWRRPIKRCYCETNFCWLHAETVANAIYW